MLQVGFLTELVRLKWNIITNVNNFNKFNRIPGKPMHIFPEKHNAMSQCKGWLGLRRICIAFVSPYMTDDAASIVASVSAIASMDTYRFGLRGILASAGSASWIKRSGFVQRLKKDDFFHSRIFWILVDCSPVWGSKKGIRSRLSMHNLWLKFSEFSKISRYAFSSLKIFWIFSKFVRFAIEISEVAILTKYSLL